MIYPLIIVTCVYVVANLLIGFWKLRATDYAGFASSKNTFGWLPITLSLTGSVVGGGMFFAVAQMGFEAGYAVMALPLSYLLGYALLACVIPRMKAILAETQGNTVYDVVASRFGTANGSAPMYVWVMSLVTFCMFFFMLAGQFSILAAFYMSVIGISRVAAWAVTLGVIGTTTVIYSMVGGVKKDILTDIMQVIVVFFGCAVATAALMRQPISAFHAAPSSHFGLLGYGVAFPIGVLLFFSPAFVGRFDYWQKLIAAKDDRQAKIGLWASIPLIFLAYILFATLGIYAKAQNPELSPANAAMWSLQHILPGFAFVAVVLALYAAVMSTSDTLLNVASVSLHHMICAALGMERRLPFARIVTVVTGVLASCVVLLAPDFVDLIVGGFSSLVILTPSILYILLSKKPSQGASVVSLLAGYIAFLVIFIGFPSLRKYAFMPGFLLAGLPVLFAWGIGSRRR